MLEDSANSENFKNNDNSEWELSPDEINDLLSRHRANSENLDRQILTLSSSILGLTFTFIRNVTPIETAKMLWCLIISWVFFIFVIISTLISFHISQRAIELRLEGKNEQCWSVCTNVINYISTALFIIAMIFLSLFVIVNILI